MVRLAARLSALALTERGVIGDDDTAYSPGIGKLPCFGEDATPAGKPRLERGVPGNASCGNARLGGISSGSGENMASRNPLAGDEESPDMEIICISSTRGFGTGSGGRLLASAAAAVKIEGRAGVL